MSKFSMMHFGRLVVGICGLFRGSKIPYVASTAINHDLSEPFLGALAPRNSLNPITYSLVPCIFCVSAFSKVVFPVINAVVVFVVHFFSFTTLKNGSMHRNRSFLFGESCRVKTVNIWDPNRTPIPLRQIFKIFGINNRVLSLRKWNQSVVWVRRLSNGVPLYPAFRHGLTSSKVVQLSRYSIIWGLLLLAPCAFAQSYTTVTSTVKDPNGTAYAFGTYTASLINSSSQQAQFGGSSTFQTVYSGSLDTNGNLSVVLPSNAVITPTGTQWAFYICANPKQIAAVFPLPALPCFNSAQTISGSSQVITFTATTIPLPGSSSSVSSTGCGPNCINAASPAYGAFHDAIQINDATWTSGVASGVQTAGQYTFTSADVGKTIWGFNGCNPASTGGNELATLGAASQTTIVSVQSGTSITISAAPTSSPVGVGCLIFGHMDDTGLAAAETALNALATCGAEQMPAAFGMISQPHWFTNPTACQHISPFVSGVAQWGNGVKYRGWGKGVSRYYLAPWFDMTKCTRGVSTVACFNWVQQGLYEDFSLDGVVNTRNGTTSGKKLSESGGYAELRNVGLHGFGAADGDLDGIYNNCAGCNLGGSLKLENVTCQAWGSRCLHQQSAATFAEGSSFQTGQIINGNGVLVSGGEYHSLGGNGYFGGYGVTNQSYVETDAGFTTIGPNDICIPDVSTAQNYCVRAVGGVTNVLGSNLGMSTGIAPNSGNGSVFCSGSGAVVNVTQSIYQPFSGPLGGSIFENPGCIVNDNSGSTSGIFTGPAGNTYSGTFSTPGRQLLGTCSGVANASVTNSLYGTGSSVTATTCAGQTSTLGTGVVMPQATTLYGLQCSSSATTVSVACTVMLSHNGGAFASTGITCTMTAATSCFDGTHTAAAAIGDRVSLQIVTGAAETGANINEIVHWNP